MNVNNLTEQIILGTLMSNPEKAPDIIDKVPMMAFGIQQNRIAYEAMCWLYQNGQSTRFTNVAMKLGEDNAIDLVGGYDYLTSLLDKTDPLTTSRRVDSIMSGYISRETRTIVANFHERMSRRGSDAISLQKELRDRLKELQDSYLVSRIQSEYEVAKEVLDKSLLYSKEKRALLGYDLGLRELNKFLDGLQKKQMVIIAARPSMGKTSLVTQTKKYLNRKGQKGIFFSIDSDAQNTFAREAANHLRISTSYLRKGILDDEKWENYREFVEMQKIEGGWIVDQAGLTVEQLRADVRKAVQMGAEFAVIDYLQNLTTERKMSNEMNYISKQIKGIAKDFDIPIIVVAQLSRAVEHRGGEKKPIMADLRDSGQIEQDADAILFLWRPSYYGFETDDSGEAYPDGYTLVIVAKNKNGPTGSFALIFEPKFMSFIDFNEDQYYRDQGFTPIDEEGNAIVLPVYEDEKDLPF